MAPFRKKDPGQVPSEHLPYEEIHKVVEQLEVWGGSRESPEVSLFQKFKIQCKVAKIRKGVFSKVGWSL